jgi:Domain of unknown function (DUF5668)
VAIHNPMPFERFAGIRTSAGERKMDREGAAMALGVVLVVIGSIFLLESLGIIDYGVRQLWPLVLIALGLLIIYERARHWRRVR